MTVENHLIRGDLLPNMITKIPGPRALELSRELSRLEAPGINTLYRGEPNILWQSALGSNVLDVDGNRYIDLTSGFGVVGIGHRHPEVVRAVTHQSQTLIHALGDAIGHPVRIELARRLCDLSPIANTQVYFAISGSDAVEVAIKTALLHHGGRRHRLLAFEPAYHGLTLGSLNLSSRREFSRPFAAHLHPQLHRLPFGGSLEPVARELEKGLYAALVVEPIVGREGVLIPPTGWLQSLRELCRQHDTLMIADEIFTGFGRTGRVFAVDHEGVVPDLICCGKALAAGLPIAAVLGSERLLASWKTAGEALHTATFVAHPLACAAGVAALDVLGNENLIPRAADLGSWIGERLADWPQRFHCLTAVRGRGLLWGLELVDAEIGGRLTKAAWSRGILMLCGGPEGRVAQLVPPLSIGRDQLGHAMFLLEEILDQLNP